MLIIWILGLGRIAHMMARTVAGMKEARICAVGSRTYEKAREFAGQYGIPKVYGSYEGLVSDGELDLIYIATPHSEHYNHIKLCFQYNKNILCEKAFTLNAEQAREVFRTAEEKGLLLTEAIWTRYMPSRELINEVLKSGIIGTPGSLTANLGYVLDQVERVMDPRLGGGALLDVGVYPINFALMAFGEEYDTIISKASFNGLGADVSNSITMTWEDGKIAVLHSSAVALTDRRGIIYGSRGYLEVENINNCEQIRIYGLDRKLIRSVPVPPQITGYEYEVLACKEAIEHHWTECPQMPHRCSIGVMEIMDEIRRQWNYQYPCEKEPSD